VSVQSHCAPLLRYWRSQQAGGGEFGTRWPFYCIYFNRVENNWSLNWWHVVITEQIRNDKTTSIHWTLRINTCTDAHSSAYNGVTPQ
jgi:hypothetical protein